MNLELSFDVVVIGGGHAGCEAAHAAARRGASTLLLSTDRAAIARMSCNPAIGGLAKGQMVREVDAMGGLMGKVADASGIHFRMLNTSKGPAVRSPRAQCDKEQYSRAMMEELEATENLTILGDEVNELSMDQGRVSGVKTKSGRVVRSRAVVIAAGTFLRGLLHVGDSATSGGRVGEAASSILSESLKSIGLELRRLKTGTPPRLDAKSLNLEGLEPQYPDVKPQPFSFQNASLDPPRIACHLTYTNERTHQIVRDNLDQSPLFAGRIEGVGPRYCPSMEDKVARFGERDRHSLFLEPEGLNTDWIYVAGLSMSLPASVQDDIIHSIRGLENARVLRHAYAVEYDFIPPWQIDASLGIAKIEGLYIAGQLNGTSGYEEAAAQGLMAGLNASLYVEGKEPVILRRDQAYIGVLIDDLTILNPTEPYRMFTSRAEHRLLLRQDNADRRLTRFAHQFGLVAQERLDQLDAKERQIDELMRRTKKMRDAKGTTLQQWLRRPEIHLSQLGERHPELGVEEFDEGAREAVEIETKYEGYITRALSHVERMRSVEKVRIPQTINYEGVPSLSAEAQEKLAEIKPDTLGQATRVAGVTPADISTLWVYLKRMKVV